MINFEHNQRCDPREYDYWRDEREDVDTISKNDTFVLMLATGGLERAAAKMTIQLREKSKVGFSQGSDLTIVQIDANLKPFGSAIVMRFGSDDLYLADPKVPIFRLSDLPAAEGYLRGHSERVGDALDEILAASEVPAIPLELIAA